MKEARKPQLDLRMSCDVGGRPESLFVSPDGSQLFVFDQDCSQVSAVSTSSWQRLERVDLVRPGAVAPTFLGGFGDMMFLGGLPGKVDVFSAVSRRFSGAIPCSGEARDLEILPELRQAVLTTVCGHEGLVELVGLSAARAVARIELPLRPVRDTLALLPNR